MSFLTNPEGVRLRYTDRGAGEQTIVLVHGWKGSHRMWDPAVLRLARDFRVIAFDTRGMGESDKPSGKYDFQVLAQDLSWVLEELDAREVTLVGWSMGCSISLEYLARGGDRAARLVLINGPLRLRSSGDFPWAMPPEQLDGYMESLAEGWPDAELRFARGAMLDPDCAFAELYYQIALQTPLEQSIRIVEEQARLDHVPLLSELEIPVLAIYGRHDPYYPTELAEYIAEHARDGRYVIFEHSAHPVHQEEPDRFRDVIADFARGELSSEGIFHAAALEIAVEAQVAFDYVSDGLRQGDWTLGSTNREAFGEGMFRGVSAFDGGQTYVRIEADRERLLVDYHVGRAPDALLRVNSVRVVPGPLVGRPQGTCLLSLMKWRAPGESDEAWRRSTLTFSTEIYIIKGRLELGF